MGFEPQHGSSLRFVTMTSHDSYDSYRPSSASPPRQMTNGHTKRPVPDDLPPPPLTDEAKATIDTLKTTYKKRGHFDALRKDIYQRFTESVSPPLFPSRYFPILTGPSGSQKNLRHLHRKDLRRRDLPRPISPRPRQKQSCRVN